MTAPRALVLTAGLGTRLRPLTYVRAKAAVPVNGEPLVRRIIRWLVSENVSDLVLNLHHQPATIAAQVGDGSDLHARVRYSWEQPVLGSAGGPRHALPLLVDGAPREAGTCFLINGDTLTDVNLDAILSAHRRSGALVTMAVIPNPRPDTYGGVLVSDDSWVTGFSRAGTPGPSWHFIGVQVAESEVFAGLDDGVPAESVVGVYPKLMAVNPRSVAAFTCNAAFRDIGTPSDYLRTSVELARLEGDRLAEGAGGTRADSARIERTAVWDDVVVGRGAELVDCIVCDGVRVPDGARYRRSAIVPAGARTPGPGERIDGRLLVAEI
jgi:NDP-sugar pyrophosphorylase family protein